MSQSLPPAPGTGTSQDPQIGTVTRGPGSKCPVVNTPVIAFMPASATTIDSSPTFWFYIPYTTKEVNSFEFVVLDENDQYVQRSINIPLSGTPGFISLRLPPKSPPLAIGKTYSWYFTIYCDPDNQEDRISLKGKVQRIS